ncbi:MAG: c-type cytochrome biogenesis protein CcmI [Alphaproteobacteria bacterium]|uniref:c-type cytochrome biogenesis protein CcmI n=1 Tax=Brevundimonas sp. TaxID=1871086 RepID=UPI0017CCD241|nr:c-type cytochrome biogenesis protein CcmI [Brevundimonas sp.]MBU3970224.1 c-type cytochrome biogenesis protein CcmI [Alphaproteobacteria bacterium]MBA3050753.1 c-type cytochrome biogenesis protein CcmI [Brevundimonas sp.]MBU3974879.1 c-type cytochrome biogenesis protein CcmI [Alphaproteobacteria bacterium]MBU4040103.1 c-type cytochrome biogenesis protein CcmI [Alphaproteobacteria bacterium]MBU4138217.1 c-type cytochrome biogenesis protein CcmI [Alphaproteobacteria bacterium]
MILWIVLTLMIALAAVGLAIPLIRPGGALDRRSTSAGVLKAQLADLDRQAEAGTTPAEDIAALRLEIERRALAEGVEPAPKGRPLGEKALIRLALGLAAVVALGGAGLYALLGRPDLPGAGPRSAAAAAAPADAAHAGADVQAMIVQLEGQLRQTPEDVNGWRMLGWSYFQTGRFAEAAEAYGRAGALEPGNAEHYSAQGEALVQAGGGQVTPAALTAFRSALRADPQDPRARYFIAVEMDQRGEREAAMTAWIDLINSAPEGAPWAAEVRTFVEDLARERGVDISARLRPAPAGAPPVATAPVAPGPTAAQVAEAGAMSPADRQAMIQGMVGGLEERLRTSPRDRDGWVRLMRARMVLGDSAAATAALRNGMRAFADSPAEQAALTEAARGLGVPGA